MHIITKATDFEVTDALKEYVEKRLVAVKKLVDPHDEETLILDVELKKISNHHRSGEIFRAEINCSIRGKFHHVESQKEDIYVAIDEAKDQLMAELSKAKGRKQSLLRRGSQKIKNMLKGNRKGDE